MNNRNRRFLFRSGGDYHLYLDTDFSGFVQPHSHVFYQLILVKTGRITQIQNGRKYEQQPGDLFFTPPGCEHSLYVFRDGTNYYCLSFSDAIAQAALALYPALGTDFSSFPAMVSAGARVEGELSALFELLLARGKPNADESGGPGPLFAAAAVASALSAAEEAARESVSADQTPDADCTVREMLRYVNERYYENITVDKLAARSGLSRAAFSKRFAALAGMPPKRYLTERRLHEALRLIHSGEMPLSRVAEEVGYQDFSTFYRSFLKMTGQAPSDYRASLDKMDRGNEYHNYQL